MCPYNTTHIQQTTHPHTNKRVGGDQSQKNKMLASTIQFSHNTHTSHTPHTRTRNQHSHQEQPHPTHKQGACVIPDTQQCTNTLNTHAYPLPSKKATHRQPLRARHTRTPLEHPPSTQKTHPHHQHSSANAQKNNLLLRKEVIQPHLPVRLPCYDFVPIADPTFDSSLTSLGHWLRVLPTFMT